MKYEVTIGIPVYNVEKYIRQTIESALAQTFESIEFLILDDCGTDSSMSIIREYQQTHPRGKNIRILSKSHNMGIGDARNDIVKEAQGRYLFFLDADDTIVPNTIELMYKYAKDYQTEIVFGSYEILDEGKIKDYQYPFLFFSHEGDFAQYVYRKYDGIQGPIWNILFSIEVFRRNQLRFQSINFWEDFSLMMDLPTYVNRVVLLPDKTYKYFCHADSLSRYHNREIIQKKEILDTINAIELVKQDSDRLRGKIFFPMRMSKVMMTDFYIICGILSNQKKIVPSFTKKELRNILNSPLSLIEILSFKTERWKNLALYLLGVLPPSLSVCAINALGRLKGVIK